MFGSFALGAAPAIFDILGFRVARAKPIVYDVGDRRVRFSGFLPVMRTVASRAFIVSPDGKVADVTYTYC